MTETKKRRSIEIYEDYWSLTVGHTDYFTKDTPSFKVLELLNEFVNNNNNFLKRGDPRYNDLQKKVLMISPKNAGTQASKEQSIRKEINQFVKIGFLEPGLVEKHFLTQKFLEAGTIKKKQRIFSQVLKDRAKFKCSVTDSEDTRNHMQFFLRTLEEVGKMNLKDDVQGLMMCDISKIKKGFLTREELNSFITKSQDINLLDRKYNQHTYLKNFLKKMIDLKEINDEVYFIEDANDIFKNIDLHEVRDTYQHRLWVNELKEVAHNKCMVDRLSSRGTGSHIKPWKDCRDQGTIEKEAWDINNGVYLNKKLDDLFDNGLISFDQNGWIIINDKTNNFDDEEKKSLKNQRLHEDFINPERLKYLEYHRKKYDIK
tara:strand:- start:18 stop:1133 length:1116 start_codon:yes stop_codon:yes gene_type:complete